VGTRTRKVPRQGKSICQEVWRRAIQLRTRKLNYKALILSCTAAALSACGGTSGVTLPELAARVEASIENPNFGNIEEATATPDQVLSTLTSASYTGYAIVGSSDPASDETTFLALGQSTVDVDLSAGTVAGSADTFFELDAATRAMEDTDFDAAAVNGSAISGSFTFSLTQTTSGENVFEGQTTGSLTKLDGSTFDANFDAGGGLIGPNGEAFGLEAFSGNSGAVVYATRD